MSTTPCRICFSKGEHKMDCPESLVQGLRVGLTSHPKPPTIDLDMLRDAFAAPVLRDALQQLYGVVSAMNLPDQMETLDAALLRAERALAMAGGST